MASMPIMIIYTFSSQDFLDFGNESSNTTEPYTLLYCSFCFMLFYWVKKARTKPQETQQTVQTYMIYLGVHVMAA